MPNRVKIGYADNVDQRLNEHRTAAAYISNRLFRSHI
ncbi:MAG: GIY-YIG nuclease family protein [Elusimicrobia bacterium]|nr:GIY-YIG nuclease family protein [Elusimicrobiota bacterium]